MNSLFRFLLTKQLYFSIDGATSFQFIAASLVMFKLIVYFQFEPRSFKRLTSDSVPYQHLWFRKQHNGPQLCLKSLRQPSNYPELLWRLLVWHSRIGLRVLFVCVAISFVHLLPCNVHKHDQTMAQVVWDAGYVLLFTGIKGTKGVRITIS